MTMKNAEIEMWFEKNKNLCSRCEWNYFDNPCIVYGRQGVSGSCPGFKPNGHEYDYCDAAGFEAKVAAKIVEGPNYYTLLDGVCQCDDSDHCPPHDLHKLSCAWCRLKAARLAVEAEMEDGNDR